MTQRGRGRPPKFPPEEVRARLLAEARRVLHEAGVESGLDAITLDGAIAAADVPRGSAYKLWQSEGQTPQDAFRQAVVVDVLRMPATSGLPATKDMIADEIEKYRDVFANGTREELDLVRRELVRTVGAFNYEKLDASRDWRIYDALRTAARTRDQGEEEDPIIRAVREGEEFLIDAYSELYTGLAPLFRMRIREPYTVHEFAAALFALTNGLAHRQSHNFQKRGILRPTGPDGEMQEWTLLSIGFEALIPQFYEPIDD